MPRKINLPENEIVALYESGLTAEQVGAEFLVDKTVICRRLRSLGIKARGRKEYLVNEEFFNQWSAEMAYVLGYVAADGCVRPERNTLSFKSIDYELLEAVRSMMASNHNITPPASYENTYHLDIYSKKIVESLIRLGIGPRKSLVVDLPAMPDEYFWDYLRGEIDGDGHVVPPKSGSRQIGVSIVGSPFFINSLTNKLHQTIGSPLYAPNPQGNARAILINGEWACKLLKLVYDNDRYGLGRKKVMAMKAIAAFDAPSFCQDCGINMGAAHVNRKFCENCDSRHEKDASKSFGARERQREANRRCYQNNGKNWPSRRRDLSRGLSENS